MKSPIVLSYLLILLTFSSIRVHWAQDQAIGAVPTEAYFREVQGQQASANPMVDKPKSVPTAPQARTFPPASNYPLTSRTMTVDGLPEDWQGRQPVSTDPKGIASEALIVRKSGSAEFSFLNVAVTVKNIAGSPIQNAEVIAFSEEWGVVCPSRGYGTLTNNQGLASLRIFRGNWTFFASWKSGNNGLFALNNRVIEGDTSFMLRPDSIIDLSVYDFNSIPVRDANVLVIDVPHIPMIRVLHCGIVDALGKARLEVTEKYQYDIVFLRAPPVGKSNGEALLFHIKSVRPSSNVTYRARQDELARINFDISNRTRAKGPNSFLRVQIPTISLEGTFDFWRDQNILWDSLALWITPEYVRFSASEYANGWTFNFHGEDIHLIAGRSYDQIYGGDTSATVLLYPEFDDWRQIWIFVEDEYGHVMHSFCDSQGKAIIPIKLIDPSTSHIVYQGELDAGVFQALIPINPHDYLFEISLNLGFFGSFQLNGSSARYYVSISNSTSQRFVTYFPSMFEKRARQFPTYAEQVYDLMSSEIGHETISSDRDGKIHVYFTLWHPGWCAGSTIGLASGWLFHPLYYPEPQLKGAFQHELGHHFQGTGVNLSNYYVAGWFGEPFASLLSTVVHTDMYGQKIGLYYQSTHSDNFFRYLDGDRTIDMYWRMFFVLMYLRQRYTMGVHRDFVQLWANYNLIAKKQRLVDSGFNTNETIAILYSFLAKENLAWLFQLGGLNITEARINEGLQLIMPQRVYSWSLLDGPTSDAPALASSSSRLYLAARGTDNGIWHRSMDSAGSWSGWTRLPGFTDARPAVAVFNSRLYFFCKQLGANSIWYGYYPLAGGVVSDTFSGWLPLDGLTPSAVSLAAASDYLYVAARGMDGSIWHRRMSIMPSGPVWSGWSRVLGYTDVSPAIAVFNNRLYLVCKQSGAQSIWYGYVDLSTYPTAWSGWSPLGGLTPDALTLASSSGCLYLVARSIDNSIWHRTMDSTGSWGSWNPASGYTLSPVAIAVFNGYMHLAARQAGTNNLWIYK